MQKMYAENAFFFLSTANNNDNNLNPTWDWQQFFHIPGVGRCIWVEELIGHLSGVPGHRHQCT